ncbi:hypothetical protein O9992_05680 [Vibrio lentus]|nr:hypothetical protein [Vibrio lentus]
MVDGSGLSRNNADYGTGASSIYWENDQQLNLIDAMPTSGTDGMVCRREKLRFKTASLPKAALYTAVTTWQGLVLQINQVIKFDLRAVVRDCFPDKPDLTDRWKHRPLSFRRFLQRCGRDLVQTQNKSQ